MERTKKGKFNRRKVVIINKKTSRERTFETVADACKFIKFKSVGTFTRYLSGERDWPKVSTSKLTRWRGYYLDSKPDNIETRNKKNWDQWSQGSENKFINNLSPDCLRGYIKALKLRTRWGDLVPEKCLKAAKERLAKWGY